MKPGHNNIHILSPNDHEEVLSSVTASLTGPLQATAGVRIEAPYIPGITIGSTVRVNSDSSPTLNGDYRILTANIEHG